MMLKNIGLLPFDSEPELSGVTVGFVAEAFDMERVAENFRGLVDVCPTVDFGSAVECEAVFRQCENRREVEVLLPRGDDLLPEHQIVISVAVSHCPVLDSVAYAVLAPSFVPGGIGNDWDDVCSVLRSGKRAILMMVESDGVTTDVLRLADSVLARHDRTRVSGVVSAVFAPQGTNWMESIRQLKIAAESLAPDAVQLIAAPIILGDTPVCSVLFVLTE